MTSPRSLLRPLAGLLLAVLLATCTDSPVTEGGDGPGALRLPTAFALKGAVPGTAQADALNAAFDQVDRFRLIIRRAGSNTVVADVVVTVEPGQEVYNLTAPVPASVPGEQFEVTVIALRGDVVLFEADPIRVASVPEDAPDVPGALPTIELEYTGPGADAASIEVGPEVVLLAVGGQAQATATVKTSGGAVIAGVPIAWSTGDPTTAGVSEDGELVGAGQGVTQFTATTPGGLSASGWAYVAEGEIAFAQAGRVRSRPVAGGAVQDRGPGGQPSWFPGLGGRLVWSNDGRVVVDGASVTAGAWPATSPDGTKLAFERDGRLWYANLDGTNATEGPAGTAPVWMPGGTHLAVGGGSIQRVRADGAERATMVAGTAALPALGAGGALAFTSGSNLVVNGGGTVASGVSGRAAWSPGADLLVVGAGGELVLVDPSGEAPPVSLGLAGASDPTWLGAAASVAPASPSLGGLDEPAIPGAEVRLRGSGFDWIIPANNRVFFPTPSGPVEGEVLEVDAGALIALMPAATTAGSIRLVTRQGESTVGFEPTSGAILVRARNGELPVPGAAVVVSGAAGVVAEGVTNAQGNAAFELAPGEYDVQLTAPVGYRITSTNPLRLRIAFNVGEAAFALVSLPATVTLEPAAPFDLPIGSSADVRVRARDADGNEVVEFARVEWTGSTRVAATGSGLTGRVTGQRLSSEDADAPFSVLLNGERFRFNLTVTAFVEGRVLSAGRDGEGVSGVDVHLERGATRVASARTDARGAYRFPRVLAGDYRIRAVAEETEPLSITVEGNLRDQDIIVGGGGIGEISGRVTAEGEGSGGIEGVLMLLIPSFGCEYECVRTAPDFAKAVGEATELPGDYPFPTTYTDSNGEYRFEGLPEGEYLVGPTPELYIAVPPYHPVAISAESPTADSVDFTLVGGSISGTVTADGEPAAEVPVTLYYYPPYGGCEYACDLRAAASVAEFPATVYTDENGFYAFEDLGPGEYEIVVEAEGVIVSPSYRYVYVDYEEYEIVEQDFALTLGSISGRVADGSEGVAEIRVTATGPQGTDTTWTDGSGDYSFEDLGAGQYEVRISVPQGYAPVPSRRYVTIDGEQPHWTDQNFELYTYDGPPVRAQVMVCGSTSYSVANFFPPGLDFPIVSGCSPNDSTQALFVTRYFGSALDSLALESYVSAGGIILTEYSISHYVWNAVFGSGSASAVYYGGGCADVIPSAYQFTPSDPFWQDNSYEFSSTTGCGYQVGGFAGITPLLGWSSTAVAVGYRNHGAGRVWATDFDWQDAEAYDKTYTNALMGYMMTRRGVVPGLRANQRAIAPRPILSEPVATPPRNTISRRRR